MTSQDLGTLLKHARTSAGISQRELSRRLRAAYGSKTADNSTVSRWEVGKHLDDKALFFTALELCGFEVTVRKPAPPSAPPDR